MKHCLLLQTQKPQTHRHKKNTHTLPVLIYYTISQLFIDKYKAIFVVCFIDLPEYRKIFKKYVIIGLMLQCKSICPNKTSWS